MPYKMIKKTLIIKINTFNQIQSDSLPFLFQKSWTKHSSSSDHSEIHTAKICPLIYLFHLPYFFLNHPLFAIEIITISCSSTVVEMFKVFLKIKPFLIYKYTIKRGKLFGGLKSKNVLKYNTSHQNKVKMQQD